MRIMRIAAGPRLAGESVKEVVRRASRNLGWTFSRSRDLWYGTARRVEVGEMDKLRAVEREQNIRSLRADCRKHLEQIAALRARLDSRDRDFHAADIAALDFLRAELEASLSR
jgi:hypothetical protein